MRGPPRPARPGPGGWPKVMLAARGLVERYALAALLLASLALVLLSKADLRIAGWLSSRAGDVVAPVLTALKEPVAGLRGAADALGSFMALRGDLDRLREENRRLLVWQAEAARLTVENESLRRTLKMPSVEAAPLWTVARVVADAGGPFVRAFLIDAGADRGVGKGMAVVDESGLVGRIVAVGARSARVLLLTDLNSKVPVVLERSLDQAILEGTNDGRPELRFLPSNPRFAVGERVLTSGRDGVLPTGLLVGEVVEMRDRRVVVRAYADWDRLDHVAVLRRAAVLPPEAEPASAVPPPVASAASSPSSPSTAGTTAVPAPPTSGRGGQP